MDMTRLGSGSIRPVVSSPPAEVPMTRSRERAVVVARVSFERTRLGPQCLAEAYARILPIARKLVGRHPKAALKAAARMTGRAEHG
jgi:hypothetical protein